MTAIKPTSALVERLRKRADEDQRCADNNKVVAEALSEQMRLFEERAGHNTYAVRMAVDHKHSAKRDAMYASDLREAISEITRLTARIAELEKALRDIAEAKMPGQARYIARTTLEASGGE